jgi:hypothetical protein
VAPKGQRGRQSAPLFHRHRSGLDQVRLAWVGLRLEATPGHHRSQCVDTSGRPAHPRERRRQPDRSAADRRAARGGAALRVGGYPLQRARGARTSCIESERFLVASGRGPYPHTDAGVEVRRIFHRLRHVAIENFNEHFKSVFDAHGARYPPRERLTPHASPSGRSSSTSWRCSIATSRIWTPTAG